MIRGPAILVAGFFKHAARKSHWVLLPYSRLVSFLQR